MLEQHHFPEIENLELLSGLKTVHFHGGGEPLLSDNHTTLLKKIKQVKGLGDVRIFYNTNATVRPSTEVLDIWAECKLVEIYFSIDDVGERFEYQRSNASWGTVKENINRFRIMRESMPNLQLQCCTTVNVFNVRYLNEVALWIALQDFDFVYWNMMHDAWYFSISKLPSSAKEQIGDYLSNCDTPDQFREEFARIIDFMNRGESSNGEETLEQIRKLDQRRQENLKKTAPELAEILGYEK